MTEKEKQDLVTEITGRISEYVDDLFIDYHNVMEIESGDVSPLLQYFLDKSQRELAKQIVEILDRQSCVYYG